MDGFGSHTFQWVNASGERSWVKFHMKTQQGIKTFTTEEAAVHAGKDPLYCQHDLYSHIEKGQFPSWTMSVQIMPEADAATYRIDPFDVTKIWPHSDYPLVEIAKIVLNRTPDNYFAETEQAAFDPTHFVPGIGPSPDRMLQARLFGYGDAHRYRLGINHSALPINAPKGVHGGACTYARDGLMPVDAPNGRFKNYEPNSFGGPVQTGIESKVSLETTGKTGHYAQTPRQVDDFQQAGDLYRLQIPDAQQRMVDNIAGSLSQVSRDDIITRSIGHFSKADKSFGERITKAVAELRKTKLAML
jgi:catalase